MKRYKNERKLEEALDRAIAQKGVLKKNMKVSFPKRKEL